MVYFAPEKIHIMISSEIAAIQEIAIHKVGNKATEDGVRFSESSVRINEQIGNLLIHYFFSSYKSEEYFNL